MTQMTGEQRADVSMRVAAKLQDFFDQLAEDERIAFQSVIRQLGGAGGETDTAGYRIREEEAAPPLPPTDRDGGLIFGRFLDPLPIGYKLP
jgi:hypothetical protein